jgi:hypothetical protein
MTVINALGWLGAAALLIAYALLERAVIQAGSRTYAALNLFGSAGLAIASAAVAAWPSTTLNAIWLIVGAVTLVRPARRTPANAAKT